MWKNMHHIILSVFVTVIENWLSLLESIRHTFLFSRKCQLKESEGDKKNGEKTWKMPNYWYETSKTNSIARNISRRRAKGPPVDAQTDPLGAGEGVKLETRLRWNTKHIFWILMSKARNRNIEYDSPSHFVWLCYFGCERNRGKNLFATNVSSGKFCFSLNEISMLSK